MKNFSDIGTNLDGKRLWQCFGCLLAIAIAFGLNLSSASAQPISSPILPAVMISRQTSLPTTVLTAIRQDLSRRTGLAGDRIILKTSVAQTWPDGCLGLARTEEICTQALVEGWRVTVTDGKQSWTYRTDATGRVIRLEK